MEEQQESNFLLNVVGMLREHLLLFSYFAFGGKIWKANVGIIYSLVLISLSRKQPVDLLSINLFVKS